MLTVGLSLLLLLLIATAISGVEGSLSTKNRQLRKGGAKRKWGGRTCSAGKQACRKVSLEIVDFLSGMSIESLEMPSTPTTILDDAADTSSSTNALQLPLELWESIGSFLNVVDVTRCRQIADALKTLAVMPVNFTSKNRSARSVNRALLYRMTFSSGKLDIEIWKTVFEQDILATIFDEQAINLMIRLKEKDDSDGLAFLIGKMVTSEEQLMTTLEHPKLVSAAVSAHAEKLQALTIYRAALEGKEELVDAALQVLDASQTEKLRDICLQRQYHHYFTQDASKQQAAFDLLKKLFAHTGLRLGAADCHAAVARWATLPLLQSLLAEMSEEERASSSRALWHRASANGQFSAFPVLFEFLGADSIPPDFLSSIADRQRFILLEKMLEQAKPVWFPGVFALAQVQTAFSDSSPATLKHQLVALKALNRYSNALDMRVLRVLETAAAFSFDKPIVSDSRGILLVTKKELDDFTSTVFFKWLAQQTGGIASILLNHSGLSSLSELAISFPQSSGMLTE